MRLKEGCHINRSLLTLGTVIRKLSKGRSGHIPFRDSKLTRILQSSLGGNARTAIICTMSPARIHVEQTRNTLLFASCAKEVTTNAQVNVVMSDKALVKQLQRELARLESELKSRGLNSVGSDSTTLLREKDLQIEKLMNEVLELTGQLDLAKTQVENVLEAAKEERISSLWADHDQHYPKLRIRYSWRTETASYSSVSEDPHSIDVGVRSFGASRCSDGQSSSSSDGHFIELPDFEENFVKAIAPPDPSIITTNFVGNHLHVKASEERNHESSDDLCKEVQCIEVEELSRNRYSNLTMLESSPNRYSNSTSLGFIPNTYVESNTSSPIMRTHDSELKEVKKEDKANKETDLTKQKELNNLCPAFIMPSPEKPSSWLLDEGMSVSRSSKLIRSKSCRARLMDQLPTLWFEEGENIESTPPIGFDKNFIGRPEDYQKKHFALKYGFDIDTAPNDITQTREDGASVDDLKGQSIETSTDWVIDSNAGAISMEDQLVQETKENSPAMSARDVKGIGLDPIQDDVESGPNWPSEFKRLQREVIELWDACNVSLVHRTYFFLLFKGDPADSFYMEVELRRLSFLKETFSQGNKAMVDGQSLTATSSKRALIQERRMLSKYMQKRLSGGERENLFLKWGVALSSSNRRLQLANRLWTKTTDMDHIVESANLVAKLVGFEEQAQTLREMFGLLNFTPKCRKKSSIWKRTLAFF
uniref:Kinesin-like protein n=1 Tax=Rhizophora mucronata TaxID=61149 RepID=A0A2P2M5N1_RHIMU